MTTIEKLNAMMNEFEMAKKANYDSTTTSHPSGSLEDKMSDPPGDGAPGKKMTQDANEHTAADKPVGEMAELTPVKTDKDENPLDTPAHSVGSGKSDTEPGTKDTKDDPGTSLPNAEVGEKYAKLNDKDLTTAAAQVADRAMARILKSGTAAPAKTPAQDAAAAGYAAAAMAGNAEKAAAIRDMLGQTIYDTIESARGAAAIIKQANADMLAAGGGAPPMDPAAMGAGAPPADPMAAMAGAGGPPPAGGGAPPMDPAAMGAGAPPVDAGGGGDPLSELLSAILEAGYSVQDVEAALAALGGGGAPPAGAGALGGAPADASAPASGGGDSTPKAEKSEGESESEKEARAVRNENCEILKRAVAHFKSGKFEFLPAVGEKAKARRSQMKQAVADILGRR